MDAEKRFDPKTETPAQFLGLHPSYMAALDEQGLTVEAWSVIRFRDQKETGPWFYRQHVLLGYVFGVADGWTPCYPDEVKKNAREAFGEDCSVLWP